MAKPKTRKQILEKKLQILFDEYFNATGEAPELHIEGYLVKVK